MTEGEERSLPSDGGDDVTDGVAGDATGGDPGPASHEERPRGEDGPGEVPSGDVPGLLSLLGGLLEDHTPDEIAVLLREEIERREFDAYASGWRDAAARFEPAPEDARPTRARPLRLVEHASGQAAVIPFPQKRPTAADQAANAPEEVLAVPDEPPESPELPEPSESTEPPEPSEPSKPTKSNKPSKLPKLPKSPKPPEQSEPPARPPRTPPPSGFVPKSRRSKVPTIPSIPKLTGPRRPRRGPAAGRSSTASSSASDDGAV
ncbi:hypothetical protein ACFQ7A_15865 [Streptomyces sp. NPDC056528]|uniref:hypothetical protein n=1 Tax=Streptomyces sp. NPDC056528 TaxID=3345854 RepID=UPI0036752033